MTLLGTVIGDYKILKKIGAGGMGIVYQGIHVRLEQEVAVKDLSPELASNPEMRTRFIREAKIQARLNHPNVVNVHNLLEHEGRLLLVMELVKGRTLDQIIQERGALPSSEAIDIIRQVLDALSFMHSKGVIHRDLKPGNIIITPEGRVKVTDFGIAKATTEQGHTRAGVRLGTLWYMSPEQIKGKSVDARSDLYAAGITLFQMVTGKLPFFGNSDFEIMRAHTETPPPNPKQIKKDISKPLANVILKLLEKDPEKRFQSAADVLKALEALDGTPESQPEKPVPPEKVEDKGKAISLLSSGKRVSPLVWIIIAILLLGAGVVVVTYWVLNRRQSIIPVVKSHPPALEKKVTSSPSPTVKATSTDKAGKEKAEGNVTPVIEEVEKKVGNASVGETEPQKKTAASPGGDIVEMTPSGVLKTRPLDTQETSEKPIKPKAIAEKDLQKPSSAKATSSKGEVVEMTPSGNLKRTTKKAQKTSKKKVKKAKTKPRRKKPKKGTKTHVAGKQKKTSSPKEKKKNETVTIDKQIGHFYQSIRKSLKDLKHPNKKSEGSAFDEDSLSGRDDYFPSD